MIAISFGFACLLGIWYIFQLKKTFTEANDRQYRLKKLLTRFTKGLAAVLAVFCIAIFCITQRGCGYNNTQQAAVKFDGVQFKDTLQVDAVNIKQPSLANLHDGDITLVKKSSNSAQLVYRNLYYPVVQYLTANNRLKLLNPAFGHSAETSLFITAAAGDTLIKVVKQKDGYFNIKTQYGDTGVYKAGVYNLDDLLRGNGALAGRGESILGNSKLLCGFGEAEGLSVQFFPGRSLANNPGNYAVFIDGRLCPYSTAQHTGSVNIDNGTEFFVWRDERSSYNRYKFETGRDSLPMLAYTFPHFYGLKNGNAGDSIPLLLTNIADTVYKSPILNVVAPDMRGIAGDSYGFALNSFYHVKDGGGPLTLSGFNNGVAYIPANNTNIKYDAAVVNFTQTNHYNFWCHIFFPAFIFWVLCWLMLSPYYTIKRELLKKVTTLVFKTEGQPDISRFNPLLPLIMLVAGSALLFRWLLMWRIDSFPPLDIVQRAEFINLTSHFAWAVNFGDSVYFSYLAALVFFVLVWYCIRCIYYKNDHPAQWLPGAAAKINRLAADKKTFARLIKWGVIGVAAIFLFTVFALKDNNEGGWTGGLFRIATIVAPVLLATGFKRLEILYFEKQEKLKLQTSLIVTLRWFIIAAIIAGFFIAKEHSFLLVFFTAWFIWHLLFSQYMEKLPPLKVLLIILVSCFAFLPLLEKWGPAADSLLLLDSSKQTACRVALLAEDKDSLLNGERYTQDWGTFKKMVETSQNQSLINSYHKQGPQWGISWGLTVQPHFEFAKAYTTQSNDLMCLRYIVAEYGIVTLVLLVVLLLLPLTCRVLFLKERKINEPYLQKRDLLLNRDVFPLMAFSVLCLLVVFSNVNWFVFMGLDLPFTNFQSKNSLMSGFLLMACVLYNYNPRFEEFSYMFDFTGKASFFNSTAFKNFRLTMCFVLLFTFFFFFCNKFVYKNKAAGDVYSNRPLSAVLQQELQPLNSRMTVAQKQYAEKMHGAGGPDAVLLGIMQNIADTFETTHPSRHIKLIAGRLRKYTSMGSRWDEREDPLLGLEIKSGFDSISKKNYTYLSASIRDAFETYYPFYNNAAFSGNIYSSDSGANGDKILAKYIWKNGRNIHVYPMKDSLPVIYNLVEYLNSKADAENKQDNRPLVLALDLKLQRNIDSTVRVLMAPLTDGISRYSSLLGFSQLSYKQMLNPDNGTGWVWVPGSAALAPAAGQGAEVLPAGIITPEFKKELTRYYKEGSQEKQYGLILQALAGFLNDHVKSVIVTAVDNLGRVRCAYYYNKTYQFDPNQAENFNANAAFVKKTSSLEFAVSNAFFTNPCLQKLPNGPGSSIKPIIYNAILSQYNFNWDGLKVANNFGHFETGSNINTYADIPIKSNWHDTLFTELNLTDDAMIDSRAYLSGSSNLYHSAMLWLGYYQKEDLQGFTGKFYMQPKIIEDIPYYTTADGRAFGIKKNQWPAKGGLNHSLLAQGLKLNFSGALFPGDSSNAGARNTLINGENLLFDFSYSKNAPPVDFFKTYTQTATAGGNPLSISPLMMAVLGGRVYTQNKGLVPGWFISDSSGYSPFVYDTASYRKESLYLNMVGNCIFKPLGDDIYGSGQHLRTLSGFTVKLRGFIKGSGGNGNELVMQDGRKMYLFAKTGTTSIKGRPSDKLLVGVLSEKNLLGAQNFGSFSSLQANKLLSFFIYGEELGAKGAGSSVNDNLRMQLVALFAGSDSFKQLTHK